MAAVYNPGDAPVVVDDGRVIGGRERVDVTLTNVVRAHVKAGRLVRVAENKTGEK